MDENQKLVVSQTPTTIVNGQAVNPSAPVPGSLSGQNFTKKPSKWRYFFIILGISQIVGIAVFFLVLLSVSGETGSEFVGLFLLMTLVPVVGIVALVNLVGLPIYMIKNRSRRIGLIFGILSLIISLILTMYGFFAVFERFIVSPNYYKKLSEQSRLENEERNRKFAADNAKPEITKEEAIELLKTCQLKGFYYTNQTDKSNPANGGWGELSSTGVVLTKVDGEPYRISIADKLIPELVPLAREAQKTCNDLQFWHDGTYEQYKDGKWYFKDQVTNNMNAGITKTEAVTIMQSCKVDYFVGYSDINLVKDSNTRSWLNKAEQSSTGIEISESAPKSYVFTSKAMTTELQDKARQYRQQCYNQKKLYVTIDDWIETEYPVGTWTRVKQ